MKRTKPGAEAEIGIQIRSPKQLKAVAAALAPEAFHPAGGKAHAKINQRGHSLIIRFVARDSASLRAIVSSYLRMVKASSTVCSSLETLEGKRT